MEGETKAIQATPAPPDLEPRLVHVGDIRFELGETSLGGNTPRGAFLYVPITGGNCPIGSLRIRSPKAKLGDSFRLF